MIEFERILYILSTAKKTTNFSAFTTLQRQLENYKQSKK